VANYTIVQLYFIVLRNYTVIQLYFIPMLLVRMTLIAAVYVEHGVICHWNVVHRWRVVIMNAVNSLSYSCRSDVLFGTFKHNLETELFDVACSKRDQW